ncbi:MAG: cytochrome B6 [bacterium]|nr:cytochrome B6 [bacterium]
MSDQVPSSPHFFRLIRRGLLVIAVFLLVAAWLVPAPLETAADPMRPPNPAKSAWFLLWIQELVSHGTAWMYVVLLLAGLFVALPWLRRAPAERAAWFQPGERLVGTVVLVLFALVVVLTATALFLRGENWQLRGPF